MKNIRLLDLEKHKVMTDYKFVEEGIYDDLHDQDGLDANFRIALSFELEENENSQYPLEDVLDEYYLHVADFLDFDTEAKPQPGTVMNLELGGALDDVRNAKELVGRRAYNEEFDQDGKAYVRLKID